MPSDVTGPWSASASPPPELLVLRTSPPKERADAERNRAAILDAAATLFREHGVASVNMDAIAAAAGVGKGTLFRRFTNKAGLAVALLDTRERDLQQAILYGPAPLGPGNQRKPPTPQQRLTAFVDAYLDYVLAHLDLVHMSETASPGARYRIGAYRFWHRHVALLLTGRPDPDTDAHILLAPLAAEHVRAVLPSLGEKRIRAAMNTIAVAYTSAQAL